MAIQQLPFNESELSLNRSQSREMISRLLSQESAISTMSTHSSVLSSNQNLTTTEVLSFYTDLLLLMAYCASGVSCSHTHSSGGSAHTATPCVSKQKQSAIARTTNILQNLIKPEDLVGILSLKIAQGTASTERGLSPCHKEAAVLFLERVYGITNPELLLKLLTDAFLPDIKLALKLVQVHVRACSRCCTECVCVCVYISTCHCTCI